MTARAALRYAADVAQFLWELVLLSVVLFGIGWVSWQVRLEVMFNGGSQTEQVWALVGGLAVGVVVIVVAAVWMSGKWKQIRAEVRARRAGDDRVWVKTR